MFIASKLTELSAIESGEFCMGHGFFGYQKGGGGW